MLKSNAGGTVHLLNIGLHLQGYISQKAIIVIQKCVFDIGTFFDWCI
jgi:hypothetical protein